MASSATPMAAATASPGRRSDFVRLNFTQKERRPDRVEIGSAVMSTRMSQHPVNGPAYSSRLASTCLGMCWTPARQPVLGVGLPPVFLCISARPRRLYWRLYRLDSGARNRFGSQGKATTHDFNCRMLPAPSDHPGDAKRFETCRANPYGAAGPDGWPSGLRHRS